MNFPIPTIPNAAKGDTLDNLRNILSPSINISSFQRKVGHLEKELNKLMEYKVKIRASGTLDELKETLGSRFKALDLHPSEVLNDILVLIEEFKNISNASKFRIFLSTVDSNMCRKFHTDINDLRMICTYLGKGTLWLSEEGLDRDFLINQNREKDFVPESKYIKNAQAGEVLILKGALYHNGEAVIHRSPAIEGLGEKRLLLRIDTNESFVI